MNRRLFYPFFVLVLLALFAQLLFSAKLKSPTVDEPNHLTRGYVYLTTRDLRFSRTTGHPPLINSLCALPLTMLPEIGSPRDYAGWQASFLNAFATTFIFSNPVPLERLIFLGRLPVMAMTLVLVALLARWAGELYGLWGGGVTLMFCALDPNLIAHGRLATTDVGVALFFTLTLYLFWRFLSKPSIPLLAASGIALGLAQCTKFSAILLLPVLGVLGLIKVFGAHNMLHWPNRPRIAGRRWLSSLLALSGAMIAVLVLAALAIWVVYGLNVGKPDGWAATVPAPQYVEGLRTILTRVSTDRPTFLLGQRLPKARWDYFLVALGLKTPLAVLIALLLASISSFVQHPRQDEWPLVVISVVYFATSMRSALNLGYRHLMPVLPFLWIAAGRMGLFLSTKYVSVSRARLCRAAVMLLIVWQAVGTLSIYPDYLAYFNELAGGPDGGWRYLVDSNLDWGQDLYALQAYADQHGDMPLYLSWFGSTYPYLYTHDLAYRHLPGHYSFPYANEMARSPYNPFYPVPGRYAISATNLQMGVSEGDIFAPFRTREPVARIGHSIFVYEVPDTQAEANPTCISGLEIKDLAPAVRAPTLERGPGPIKWFNRDLGFILPGTGETAYVLPSPPLDFAPDWQALFLARARMAQKQAETDEHAEALIYYLDRASAQELDRALSTLNAPLAWSPATQFGDDSITYTMSAPVAFDSGLELLGYRLLSGTELKPGDKIGLVTVWRITAEMPPASGDLKAFVHLLDTQGQMRDGQDRLDSEPLTWEPGDLVVQVHRMQIPGNAAQGTYQVELGLYIPDTMQRLTVHDGGAPVADRLLLQPIEVAAP